MNPFLSRLVLIALTFSPLAIFAQGSLLPAGAPAPTMKTLAQIEARTPVNTLSGDATASYMITQPGSYYLTGSIQGASGKDGIRIEADNVTLDLNGFTIEGVGGSLNAIHITAASGVTTVRNGLLRFWGQRGIYSESYAELNAEDVSVLNVQNVGISVTGACRFERCTVNGAVDYGLFCNVAGGKMIAVNCRVSNITSTAFTTGINAPDGVVSHCTVSMITGGQATMGIALSAGLVEACVVKGVYSDSGAHTATGIISDRVTNCVVQDVGKVTFDSNAIGLNCREASECQIIGVYGIGSYGIYNADSVRNCNVGHLNGTNSALGISANQVLDCNVHEIGASSFNARGISINSEGLALRNRVSGTSSHGIYAGLGANVRDNTIFRAGNASGVGSAIYAGSNTGVRIEGNHVNASDTGIEATSATAVVVRNTARGNTTNFTIHANMPVVTPATLGTNPNANVSQ